MKTLIEYAISCGNENTSSFRNENAFQFTTENENTFGFGNENENGNENHFRNENETPKNRRNEPTLHTKWGTAKVNPESGYYTIISGKHQNKLLHRLIFEDFYGFIPKNHVIHHKNGDKLCNCLLNLQLMGFTEHLRYHYKQRDLTNNNIENTTGYYRVSKSKCKQCKQGFIYRYQYYDENYNKKAIFATKLKKLEEKVKKQKLLWRKLQ